jgi:hypothetical protein
MSGIDGLTDNDTSRHGERVPQCAKSDFITCREAELRDTYAEGFDMLVKTMNGCHDRRGGNLERTSVTSCATSALSSRTNATLISVLL